MKTRKIVCSALALMLAMAAPLAAQEKDTTEAERAKRDAERQMRDAERQMRDAERAMREAARKMTETRASQEYYKQLARKVVVFGDNARLGLVLRSERDPTSDAIGATVQALTPGGPAEEAGLQPGDVIVKFNGEALAVPAGTSTGSSGDEEEGPTDRLMEHASSLKEGDVVTLEVRRGDTTKTYTVTARRLYGPKVKVFSLPDGSENGFDFDVPEPPEPPEAPEAVVAPGAWTVAFTSGISGLEMVTLNPDLGEYFGTKEGILVVRVRDGSPFKLKAGDIILKIGDRAPTSPSQALRILRSYGPGETVPIEVMRNHQRTTISTQLPEHRSEMYWTPEPALAPVPEAPATPHAISVSVTAPPAPPPPPVPAQAPSTGARTRV
jgi:C-terminal processing protease CtpA/Prc